jgi:predicted RNase H-like HicB family nuclease
VTVRVHQEDSHYWAEVEELPGCFACGDTLDELWEVLEESIGLYLSNDRENVTVSFQDVPEPVTVERVEKRKIAVSV